MHSENGQDSEQQKQKLNSDLVSFYSVETLQNMTV